VLPRCGQHALLIRRHSDGSIVVSTFSLNLGATASAGASHPPRDGA